MTRISRTQRLNVWMNGIPVGRPIWLVLLQDGLPAFVSPRSEAKEIRARCDTPVAIEWVEWQEPVPAPMTHQDALAKYIEDIAPEARTIGVDFALIVPSSGTEIW